jgi:PAS domain S-box-containing protein
MHKDDGYIKYLGIIGEDIENILFVFKKNETGLFVFEMVNQAFETETGLKRQMIENKTPLEVFDNAFGNQLEQKLIDCHQYKTQITFEASLQLSENERNRHFKLTPVIKNDKVEKIMGHSIPYQKKTKVSDQSTTCIEELKVELRERNKEITCLFHMSEIVQEENLTVEELLQSFVKLIPPAFQFPEYTAARIVFRDKVYKTDHFFKSNHKMESDIFFHGKKEGFLEIFIMDEKAEHENHPFLDSEKKLINSLTERTGRIIERKWSENKLADSEQEFRTLFETMAQGVVYHDAAGEIIKINPAAEKILGLSLSQIKGRVPTDPRWRTVHQDGSPFPGDKHPASRALKTGKAVYGEIMGVYHPIEHRFRWLKVNAIPQFHENNSRPFQVYASFEDITDEIIIQKELQRSRQKFFELFNNSKNGVAIYTAIGDGEDFIFVDVNKAVERIEQIRKEDLIGKRVSEIFSGVKDFGLFDVFQRVFKTGKAEDYKMAFYKDDRVSGWRDNRVYKLDSGEIVAVYSDATDQKIADEEARKFKTIADNSLYGICITDTNGIITYTNKYFAEIHGYKKKDLIALDISLLLDSDQYRTLQQNVYNKISTEKRFPAFELWHRHTSGDQFPMLMSGVVLKDATSQKQYIAISGIDISEQKHLQQTLEKQKNELREFNEEMEGINEELRESEETAIRANKVKSEFLATMSHELRTPLNGVLGFSQILASTKLDVQQKEYLNTIIQSAKNLLSIISDILDIAKIETDKINIVPEEMNLKEVIRQSVKLIEIQASEKALKVIVNVSEDCPEYVQCDASRLKQILLNLLGNAVKFTFKGRIVLKVEKKEENLQKALVKLRFSIIDTGIGIKEENQASILKAFTQVDMTNTRKYGGTGLGLSIVQKLLKKMNSTIEVDSAYGKGSTFSFDLTLPVSIGSKEKETTLHQINTEKSNLNHTNILIVEDNPINMFYTKTALSLVFEEFNVFEAVDGKKGYEQFLKEKPDLILMDIRMPNMDGYQTTSLIRKLNKDIPIIALTAKTSKNDKQKCFEVGMNGFLSKPVSVHQLKNVIKKHIPN